MTTGLWTRPIACAAGLVIAALNGVGAYPVPPPRFALDRTFATQVERPVGPATLEAVAPAELAPVPIPERAAIHPFETVTVPTASEGLGAKWRMVERNIDAEMRVLARCRLDRAGCSSPAALRFITIIDAARNKTGRARIGEVNRAINLSIRPMRDLDQYGVDDFWSSPLATLATGAGDCEDYAIAKYVALQEAGVAEDDLRLAVVYDATTDEHHAVVMARLDGRWLVLDNRWLALVEIEKLTRYLPLFSIGHDGMQPLAMAELLPASAPSRRDQSRL